MTDRELYVNSLMVIHWLCDNIKEVKDFNLAMPGALSDDILPALLAGNALVMESLGNLLNSIDCVQESDAWMNPIFDAMHKWQERTGK